MELSRVGMERLVVSRDETQNLKNILHFFYSGIPWP
jgi:hypothetical protein